MSATYSPPDVKIDAATGSRLLAMVAPTAQSLTGTGSRQINQGLVISADQARDIESLLSEVGADRVRFLAFMGASSVAEIVQPDLQKAHDALERKRKEADAG